MNRRRGGGYTLIELMVVVVVVGLLAALALPAYQDSVRKTRRSDARVTLSDLAQSLERCRTQFGRYDDPACPVPAERDSDGRWYRIAVDADAATFAITATAQRAQTGDTACRELGLDHLGQRSAADADGHAAGGCW